MFTPPRTEPEQRSDVCRRKTEGTDVCKYIGGQPVVNLFFTRRTRTRKAEVVVVMFSPPLLADGLISVKIESAGVKVKCILLVCTCLGVSYDRVLVPIWRYSQCWKSDKC